MEKEHKYYLGKCDGYGNGRKCCKSYVTWSLVDGKFSMSGEVWNQRMSDCIMCGQCLDHLVKLFPHNKKLARMVEIWERWHLNDMRAGCPHQIADKWDERPIDPSKPTDTYIKHPDGSSGWNMLVWLPVKSGGLLGAPCPVCGYKYGTAWLREEIPAEIVKEIESWSAPAPEPEAVK